MDAGALSVTDEQRIIVRERLRLLAIAAYIRGGMIAVFSSFFLIYVVFMVGITLIPDSAWQNSPPAASSPPSESTDVSAVPPERQNAGNQAPPKFLFRIMAACFGVVVLLGWAIGGLTAYAGWCIHRRRRKMLIYVVAVVNCIFLPYGTLFGVAAIIVLSSAPAKFEFEPPTALADAVSS